MQITCVAQSALPGDPEGREKLLVFELCVPLNQGGWSLGWTSLSSWNQLSHKVQLLLYIILYKMSLLYQFSSWSCYPPPTCLRQQDMVVKKFRDGNCLTKTALTSLGTQALGLTSLLCFPLVQWGNHSISARSCWQCCWTWLTKCQLSYFKKINKMGLMTSSLWRWIISVFMNFSSNNERPLPLLVPECLACFNKQNVDVPQPRSLQLSGLEITFDRWAQRSTMSSPVNAENAWSYFQRAELGILTLYFMSWGKSWYLSESQFP